MSVLKIFELKKKTKYKFGLDFKENNYLFLGTYLKADVIMYTSLEPPND